MAEKEIAKTWTARQEAIFNALLSQSDNFGDKWLLTSIKNILKYDGRTKAFRIAREQQKLLLAIATDEELEQIARSKQIVTGKSEPENLRELKLLRDKIREEGVRI